MGPLEVDEAYLDHRQSLYFLEAMAMYQQHEREEAETPHDECLTFLVNVAFVAARAAYDVKHAKPRNARHQYKCSVRDVSTVVQEALDYRGKWKAWELHNQPVKDAEPAAVQVPSGTGPLEGAEHAGLPSGPDILSDPPTQTGVLSDPPNQTGLLTHMDADIPSPPRSHRPSDLDVLDAALARIRAFPTTTGGRSPPGSLKRPHTESPEPAAAGAPMQEPARNDRARFDSVVSRPPAAPPTNRRAGSTQGSTSKTPHGEPHNRPGSKTVRTPLPTFSTPGFGKVRPQTVMRPG
ncbi:hypothetical protein OH76DRAFT_1489945 [Lentinus brumalis]|uniref:Uncharacterized protein n=1 Tax=Lentinus brumalis TaxID=2498619 RepID=A0A371CKN7_9APHY|nr:hypothetical protein OH76DRAFT_1489945 [Polyporus brumalis]